MKKIFSIILILSMLVSMNVIVHAEKQVIDAKWGKYLGSTDVTESQENGETIYSFGGINAAYHSAGVDILPVLKKYMEGNDSITVEISLEVRIDYAEGFEGEEFPIGLMLRANNVHEKIKKKTDFLKILPESTIHVVNGDSNYGCRIGEEMTATDDEWTLFEDELVFTPDDVNAGLWDGLILCFDKMSAFEAVKTVHVKNTSVVVVDSQAGTGEPTIDLDSYEEEIIEYDDTVDTPALPEGNKLLNDEWVKGLGSAVAEKSEFNGTTMYKITEINSSFSSVFLDIYPSVKEIMGDNTSVNLWIVLDVRARGGKELPFGMKIRPAGVNESLKSSEGFAENYTGATFKYTDSTSVCATMYSEGNFTNTWQRIEMPVIFTSADINDEFWTGWNLCFDMMTEYGNIKELQIKNVGIYLNNEYEPVNISDDSENTDSDDPESSVKSITIYRPIGFNKYTATFAEVVDTEVEGGLVDMGSNDGKNNTAVVIIIAVAAAVVVIGAVIGIVISKKKSEVKEDKE